MSLLWGAEGVSALDCQRGLLRAQEGGKSAVAVRACVGGGGG